LLRRQDYPFIRIEASAPGAGALRLRLFHGWVYSFGKAMGIQDLDIGDPAFDDQFVIKGNDVHFVRAWLDDAARAAIAAAGRVTYTVKRERAVGRLRERLEQPEQLVTAVHAVGAIAHAGERHRAAWERAAAALGAGLGGEGWSADGGS